MNQRIREIMIQAIADVDSIDDPETRRMYIPNCFAGKFAELIVRECAKVLTRHGSYFSGEGEPYHYAASLIEEHFGVEE